MGEIEYAIVSLMNEQHMSQAELARLSGISTSSLSRYLGGDDMPSSKLRAIAEVLGVSTDRLLGLEEDAAWGESELVGIYRALDAHSRAVLLSTARALASK